MFEISAAQVSLIQAVQERVRRARADLHGSARDVFPIGSTGSVRSGESEFTLEILGWYPRNAAPTSPGVSVRIASIQKLDAEPLMEGMQFCTDLESLLCGVVARDDYESAPGKAEDRACA